MRLYFDANALIQAVERQGPSADAFQDALLRAWRSGLTAVTSELSLAELLVHPIRDQDLALISAYTSLLAQGEGSQMETLPVTRDLLTSAAKIRARYQSIKLPDAIHIATAEDSGCTHLISGDKRLAGSTRLPVLDPIGTDLPAFIELFS